MKYVKTNFSYVMEKALVALFVYIDLTDHGMTTFIWREFTDLVSVLYQRHG